MAAAGNALVAPAALPTLSQIRNWDTTHLERATRDWSDAAEGWEDSFSAAHRESLNPGGTDWDGRAAEAAQERTLADLYKVRSFADTLHSAAATARKGASDLHFAQHQVLDSVGKAESAGFDVRDDLSLVSRKAFAPGPEMTAKLAEGQALSAEINSRASALTTLDAQVAGKITIAVGPLRELNFPEAPMGVLPPRDGTVQAVDFKSDKTDLSEQSGTEPGEAKPVIGADGVKDVLRELERGIKKRVRQVMSEGELRGVYDRLTGGAVGDAPPTKPGVLGKVLPDGTIIRWRPGSESGGPTIDVQNLPGGKDLKVHLPHGGSPILTGLPPLNTPGHPPLNVPWPQALDPSGLPPWLQVPNTALPVQPGVTGAPPSFSPGVPVPVPLAPTPTPSDPWSIPQPVAEIGGGALAVGGAILGGGLAILQFLEDPTAALTPGRP